MTNVIYNLVGSSETIYLIADDCENMLNERDIIENNNPFFIIIMSLVDVLLLI